MVKYNNSTSHRGHNAIVPGASGCGLKEHEVAQKIHDKFRAVTKAVDATDNVGRTANDNLYNIVKKMNAVGKSFHVSHHLNAFNGTANGFEVWYYAGNAQAKKLAEEICTAVCKVTGWVNRGAKATTSLYVIRASSGSAILIEWGFVDSQKDMDIMAKKMDAAVNATLAVFGYATNSAASKPSTPPTKPSTPAAKPPVKPNYTRIEEDGMFGPGTANRAMEYEGMTPDDEISHQYRQACNKNLYAAKFDKTLIGSNLIRTWQKRLKAKGFYKGAIDGLCGTEMIKAMQRALKTTVDGIISPKSDMVKALQRALNNNKLPW